MTETLTNQRTLAYRDTSGSIRVQERAREDVKRAVLSFLDAASTATGQATFYNKKAEQLEVINAAHDAVFTVNRGLYAAMLTMPGILDVSIQRGVSLLLGDRAGCSSSLITDDQEDRVISYLSSNLSVPRLLKLFGMIREKRINNKRTRRLILSNILGSKNLQFWAVKYRIKMRDALTHAWGQRVTSSIRKIADDVISGRDVYGSISSTISKNIGKYTDREIKSTLEAIAFIFGSNGPYTEPLFKAYFDARTNLDAGSALPTEVLEGIRGRFHKSTPSGKILELTARTMTEGQKLSKQSQAKKSGVKLDFDPTAQDIVKLYVYCLQTGTMTDEIRNALKQKATRIADTYPLRYRNVGIVLDCSRSMFGVDAQKYRPIAIGLSMRDVLSASALGTATFKAAGGIPSHDGVLVTPSGDTSLAEALVEVAQSELDAIYIITDGYENAPAGRVDEVIRAMRGLGMNLPIYQVTPVMASEKAGVRVLSNQVTPMPISSPEGLGLSMIRAALSTDVEQGILSLLNMTLPRLTNERSHNG